MNEHAAVYRYIGQVVRGDYVVDENWKAETVAGSEKQAKNNLKYRWKKENGYSASSTPISLPMELIVVKQLY